MNKINKLIIVITTVGVIGLVYYLYQNYNKNVLYKDLIDQKEKYEQLTKYVAKLETDYKKQRELEKLANKRFKEVEIEKDNKIRSLTEIISRIDNNVNKKEIHDLIYKGKKISYTFDEIRINGKDSPPVGWIMIKNDGKIVTGNYRFELRVDNMQTEDEKTGRIKVYSKLYWISKQNGLKSNTKKWKDVQYSLPIMNGSVVIDPIRYNKKSDFGFYLWNPKFALGIGLGIVNGDLTFKPNISLYTITYGDKKTPKFKFLGLGVGIGKVVDFQFRPLAYSFLSLFSNTYIYPYIGIDTNSKINTGLGIELNF